MRSSRLACAIAGSFSLTASSAAARDCGANLDALPQVVERPALQYLFLGETHGTAEAPDFFGDIACQLSDRQLLVAVEWPAENQVILDAFMAEPDPDQALSILLRAPALLRPDGRGSKAMIDLLRRMWRLKNGGRWVGLVAFDYVIPTPRDVRRAGGRDGGSGATGGAGSPVSASPDPDGSGACGSRGLHVVAAACPLHDPASAA